MAYIMTRFIETRIFTRQVTAYLEDGDYLAMQHHLLMNPDAGMLIRGAHGLRKLRWGRKDKGKRGGLRLIYFHDPSSCTLYMLYLYLKADADDLTDDQVRQLSDAVLRELK